MAFAGPLVKPAKGSGWLASKQRRREIVADERREKDAVRRRDHYQCRWPACEHAPLKPRLEVAHLDDKGMGGDHGLRTTRDRMLLLCFLHHQGAVSLHSGDLRIDARTAAGADGCLDFYARHPETGRMELQWTETSRGISVERNPSA